MEQEPPLWLRFDFKVRFPIIIYSWCALLLGCVADEVHYQPEVGTVSDIEGHIYSTVKIGDQWWMSENLRTRYYSDSTPIFQADEIWLFHHRADSTDFLIDVNENGILYNHLAAESVHLLAPKGWRIATDEDWKMLEENIGMVAEKADQWGWRGSDEANSICLGGVDGWHGILSDADNRYGLTVKPTGIALPNGSVSEQNNSACFWTSEMLMNGEVIYRMFDENQQRIFRQKINPGFAMAIRCVKN